MMDNLFCVTLKKKTTENYKKLYLVQMIKNPYAKSKI